MTIKRKQITDYIPDPHNANKGTERGQGVIERSLEGEGAGRSILATADGVIIAGNKTMEAAVAVGITEVIEVETDGNQLVVVKRVDLKSHKSKKAKRLAIADNRASQLSLDFDPQVLMDLNTDGILDGLFTDTELQILFEDAGLLSDDEVIDPEPQLDRAGELQAVWQVKRGDVWIIPSQQGDGQHRLMCGDSTSAEDVARLMDGEKANAVITDPPYGVKMDKGFSGSDGFNGKGKAITRRSYDDQWDSERPSKETFDLLLKSCHLAIIFGGNFFADYLPCSTHWAVWDKLNTMPTFGDCELIWTNSPRKSVKKFTFEYNGLIGKETDRYHPTQKPVGLITQIITEYTTDADTILDTYSGSGTTLVACEQTGRYGRAMEIEPKYVSVALQRLADMGLSPYKQDEK